MNSYTYMHNHKVLNDKPNEIRINNCNCFNKDNCSLPNSCQTKCTIYQANIDCNIAGYKRKCYLGFYCVVNGLCLKRFVIVVIG